MIDSVNHSSLPAQRAQHQQLSRSFSGLTSAESAQWPFRGSAFHLDSRRRSSFHLDSRSALVKSVERAAKQQQLSDGYQSVFDQLPTGQYVGDLHVGDVDALLLYMSSVIGTF